MTGMREKDSADFDLEAFIDLFDEALTSDDPSVQKTLQHLMVIAALARNHAKHDQRNGPLRRLFDDQRNIIRRLERLETGPGQYPGGGYNPGTPYGPVIMPQPYRPTTPVPGTGTGGWPGPGPNQIWCGTSTSATSVTIPNSGAVAKSTTSYAYDPSPASEMIAERVEDLLKSNKYKGSTIKPQEC
jgi:hypothetical protein